VDTPDAQALLVVGEAGAPARAGLLEDLLDVAPLGALERDAQSLERQSAALGVLLEEAQGGAEGELAVVELARDARRGLAHGARDPGEHARAARVEPDELASQPQVLLVDPELGAEVGHRSARCGGRLIGSISGCP